MFDDEMNQIALGMSLDKGIKARRARGPIGQENGFTVDSRKESERQHPTVGRKKADAALNDLTGRPWWEHHVKFRPKKDTDETK